MVIAFMDQWLEDFNIFGNDLKHRGQMYYTGNFSRAKTMQLTRAIIE
jgi:hypothetical protein